MFKYIYMLIVAMQTSIGTLLTNVGLVKSDTASTLTKVTSLSTANSGLFENRTSQLLAGTITTSAIGVYTTIFNIATACIVTGFNITINAGSPFADTITLRVTVDGTVTNWIYNPGTSGGTYPLNISYAIKCNSNFKIECKSLNDLISATYNIGYAI